MQLLDSDVMGMTILDLDSALGGGARLLIGGGYGLYLKQQHLEAGQVKTLLPHSAWPNARTTEDIDLFLRADVFATSGAFQRVRTALDDIGFQAVEDAKWMKFARNIGE